MRVHTSTDPTLLAGIDRFLETVPRRFIRDSHAIRITTGRSAPQQAATVELAVPAALTARSASQDEYLVWARYPQAGDDVPPHTYLTADVRYIQARDLLRRGPSAPSALRRPAPGLPMQAGGRRQCSRSGPRQRAPLLLGPPLPRGQGLRR